MKITRSLVYYIPEYDIMCVIDVTRALVPWPTGEVITRSIEILGDRGDFRPYSSDIDEILFYKMEYIGKL